MDEGVKCHLQNKYKFSSLLATKPKQLLRRLIFWGIFKRKLVFTSKGEICETKQMNFSFILWVFSIDIYWRGKGEVFD